MPPFNPRRPGNQPRMEPYAPWQSFRAKDQVPVALPFAGGVDFTCTSPRAALVIVPKMKRRIAIFSILLAPVFLTQCKADKKEGEAAPAPAPAAAVEAKNPKVRLKTNMGDIVLELDKAKAPLSVANFLGYVADKHYDGTAFHRVIDGFMIQGGGFALTGGNFVQKPTKAPISNEGMNGLKNDRGTIAMARTSNPNSATSQFFINVKDNNNLNYPSMGGYAVFGKVVEGMDVVDKIRQVPTGPGGMFPSDVPQTPVVIKEAVAE